MLKTDEEFAPAAQPELFYTISGTFPTPARDQHYGERQEGKNQRGPPAAVSGRLLRVGEVAERLSMGKSTILRHVKLGTFPRPFKNQSRVNVWPESVIDQHVEELMASERDEKEPTK